MASTKAVQQRFERLDPYELARKELFAEGISSSKIYLDPLRPSVEDLLDMITSGLRSSFTYAGARTVSEFHENALVGIQSAAGCSYHKRCRFISEAIGASVGCKEEQEPRKSKGRRRSFLIMI